jgi:hypothetical protein
MTTPQCTVHSFIKAIMNVCHTASALSADGRAAHFIRPFCVCQKLHVSESEPWLWDGWEGGLGSEGLLALSEPDPALSQGQNAPKQLGSGLSLLE